MKGIHTEKKATNTKPTTSGTEDESVSDGDGVGAGVGAGVVIWLHSPLVLPQVVVSMRRKEI